MAFVDMSTVVAYRVGDIEREIVASLLGCHLEQLTVLGLRDVPPNSCAVQNRP